MSQLLGSPDRFSGDFSEMDQGLLGMIGLGGGFPFSRRTRLRPGCIQLLGKPFQKDEVDVKNLACLLGGLNAPGAPFPEDQASPFNRNESLRSDPPLQYKRTKTKSKPTGEVVSEALK